MDHDSVFSRFAFDKVKPRSKPLNLHNYFPPLTSQVEALAPCIRTNEQALSVVTVPIPARVKRKVSFTLPSGHTEKNSTEWHRSPRSRSKKKPTHVHPKAVSSEKAGVRTHRDRQVQGQSAAFDHGNCPVPRPSFAKQYWSQANARHAKQKRVRLEAKSCLDKKMAALTESQLKQGVLTKQGQKTLQ